MAWKRIIFFIFFISSIVQADEISLKKIVDLYDPWGSSFINKNEIILTEKEGEIKIVNINTKNIFNVEHNLNFIVDGQGGLLDILHKDNNIWISYTENRGDWKTSTSIARAKLNKKNYLFLIYFKLNLQ